MHTDERAALDPAGEPLPSVPALVSRFAVAGAIVLAGVLLATTLVSEDLGNQQALAEARQVARLTGIGLVQPRVSAGVLDGDPRAVRALDEAVRRSVLTGSLVRVKLWTADGTIAYSDEGRLIGESFPPAADRTEALRTGVITSEVTDLTAPENRFEAGGDPLLEVYVPLLAADGTPVLYEAYFRLDGVREAGRRTWLAFAPVTVGALAVLQLVQIPLAWSLARRIRTDAVRRAELLRGALQASDVERRRIASDLHDGVVQDLTGVSFALAAAGAADPDGVAATSAAQLRDSLRQLRSLLVDIYPPDLAEEGLGAALEDLVTRVQALGVAADLQVADGVELPTATAALAYRIAQEALRNVAKHADASIVVVGLAREGGEVVLRVEDDGVGFDPDRVGGEAHLGMRILRDAAAAAGGRLVLRTAPGAGTEVELRVPVPVPVP